MSEKTGRAPTQRDVAAAAGVSTATVSYILSGRRDRVTPVTPETRDRVLRAVEQLGYRLDHSARSLRRRRTELVCVVYRMPDSPWVERLAEQVQAIGARSGYSMIALPLPSSPPAGPEQVPQPSALRVLRERYVDGAIVANGTLIEPDELRRLAAGGLSLVVFHDALPPAGFDVVDLAQRAALTDLVAHLLDRGHTRIGYLAHDVELAAPDDEVQSLKYRTVAAALAAAGAPLDPRLVVPGADVRERAYVETQRLLRNERPPTALISSSDRGAIDAIWAARDLGASVPGDLAIAGIGNGTEGSAIRPALTTVGLPRLDFTVPVTRLFERITAPDELPGDRIPQPWQLIVREST
ncbi:LacI family DNA-binding transcriptional regulator [Actinocatenispora sera]|uniref:LacI family transcriptional regulator n=1 Tax=Actinocatenispora sera TaxID=390989 RepID=A0A810L263_9ACTN|nr:LacI family DNA-binding transcriptional regulator [Actinocatenispora sera]BCJ29534.1 LacI family transcriptional regulator [Actinocatenispora sera]